ncbi:hypothetical protein HRR90_002745 [Exophiala dermatitidis]|uniref:Fibronectin type-III domain-containing protein n=1 Tax=Exophiala dermatitidis TaxID=5970 RepID=A0AAN6ERC2_EXODE|nr:hypothetical protein HRR90_002745 [Exophiala dermatitidis]KAJ8990096.1 hypothetical protein HRR80_006227 [Exophiala dermatitidis]KAJ9000363.1 hypothetical protein HRR94_004944 [Exophiala dermatitidis]
MAHQIVMRVIACLFWLQCVLVYANVEKIIFLAPSAEPPPADASIDNLLLAPLSEQFPSVRTQVNASFPTPDSPKGTENWFLLEGLLPGRRYEVRICWLATVSPDYAHCIGASPTSTMTLTITATHFLLALHIQGGGGF